MAYRRTNTKEVFLTEQLFKYNNQYSTLINFIKCYTLLNKNVTVLRRDAV